MFFVFSPRAGQHPEGWVCHHGRDGTTGSPCSCWPWKQDPVCPSEDCNAEALGIKQRAQLQNQVLYQCSNNLPGFAWVNLCPRLPGTSLPEVLALPRISGTTAQLTDRHHCEHHLGAVCLPAGRQPRDQRGGGNCR